MTPIAPELREVTAAHLPHIVVIVPAYGHPVLLCEALDSVLAQDCTLQVTVLVVSDGCRLAETDTLVSAYATAHSGIIYLRKENGGPSSARNFGIDHALRCWPELDAVFFLDADNRLGRNAISTAYTALAEGQGTDWVYPHIDSFGISWTANYGIPYSPLMHIAYDNLCDTGCLVSRRILEAGVRFDEDARSGYEDWDFWLQCLDRGFRGKHADFGFMYRQRPESRFREMNRQRGSMIERLRSRHGVIASPKNLLRWEHETNPRYLYTSASDLASFAFTDPDLPGHAIVAGEVIDSFYSARQQPDEFLLWPYFVWGSDPVIEVLRRSKLIHCIYALMEREGRKADFVAVTLVHSDDEILVHVGPPEEPSTLHKRALLWMCQAGVVRKAVAEADDSWFHSLATAQPRPSLSEIRVVAPAIFRGRLPRTAAAAALVDLIDLLREHPLRSEPAIRWNWRPQRFPARETYYEHICKYVGVNALTQRLAGRALEAGLVVPIAAFGGAEKVTYALARFLRQIGMRVHLFVLGRAAIKTACIPDNAFDSINFLADQKYPIWGSELTILGEGCFRPDSDAVRVGDIAGLLATLDFVVNCHSQPLNSILGTVRSQQRAKIATYLHIFDTTPLGRPAGHPFLAVGHEHIYDLILTCSRQLADDIHALGVPAAKIMPIQNAAGFEVSAERQDVERSRRAMPRGNRNLRLLYLGRLDAQKGVGRLLELVRGLAERRLEFDIRVVGANLIGADGGWARLLAASGVVIEPPIYQPDLLADAYAWADVLLLPSRWEGAPLVIPECHQLGCIPLATRVGAVEELLSDGVDGLLVDSVDDRTTVTSMMTHLEALVLDDDRRRQLAAAAFCRSEGNRWESNFAPLRQWLNEQFQERFVG